MGRPLLVILSMASSIIQVALGSHVIRTKTQKANFMCTCDGTYLKLRFALTKESDQINSVHALRTQGPTDLGYDDIDIDNYVCNVDGDGSSGSPFLLTTKVACAQTPMNNMDSCGVRMSEAADATNIYTWKFRSRRYTKWNSWYDAIFVVSCDCASASAQIVTASVVVSNIKDVIATLSPCFASLHLYDSAGSAMVGMNNAGYFVVTLGEWYTIRANLMCSESKSDVSLPYGLYTRNCMLSNNELFSGSDVFQIVDSRGCRTRGGAVELSDECRATLPAPSQKSSYHCTNFKAITFQNEPTNRLYIKCEIVLCYDTTDSSCVQRCPNGNPVNRKKRSAEEQNGAYNVTLATTKLVVEPFQGAFFKEENVVVMQPASEHIQPECILEQTYMILFIVLCGLLIVVTSLCVILFRRRDKARHESSKDIDGGSVETASTISSKRA